MSESLLLVLFALWVVVTAAEGLFAVWLLIRSPPPLAAWLLLAGAASQVAWP